jgi:hypothetical protein
MKRISVLLLGLCLSAIPAAAADNAQQAFAKVWEGRRVTVRAPIYTIVYNERGKFGTTRRGMREGLTVATASGASYLQFDGRQGRDTIVLQDPRQVLGAVNSAYEADALDVRAYRKLEALAVRRCDPGLALQIIAVRLERDEVRMDLAHPGGTEPVTTLRVKWPTPLSKAFDERQPIEGIIGRFLDVHSSLTAAR